MLGAKGFWTLELVPAQPASIRLSATQQSTCKGLQDCIVEPPSRVDTIIMAVYGRVEDVTIVEPSLRLLTVSRWPLGRCVRGTSVAALLLSASQNACRGHSR